MELPYSFGRYTLIKKIANGGMAEVYVARYRGEEDFSKTVAIKRILPESTGDHRFTSMLIDEAKALVHLQHQNIVQVYELGREGDHLFISMEYVRGIDLKRLLLGVMRKEIKLPLKYILFIILQILQGLDFAHRVKGENGEPLNIVHRDVSPSNILCSWSGEVKVADFGIAKGNHRTHSTIAHQLKGKYSYMSPEQAAGQLVDKRTDIYAAGIVMFELLSGTRLYEDKDDLKVIQKVRRSRIPISKLGGISHELKEICCTALARDSEVRFQNAADFLTSLNGYAIEKGEITSGIEFGEYLKGIYPSEVKEYYDERPRKTRMMTVGSQITKSVPRQLLSLLIILFCVSFPASAAKKHVVIPQSSVQLETRTKAKPATESISTPSEKKKGEGTLSVNALPWGYVTVPGYLSHRETPVRIAKIREGDYILRVEHPPTKSKVSRKIEISEGRSLRCLARFTPKKIISCH